MKSKQAVTEMLRIEILPFSEKTPIGGLIDLMFAWSAYFEYQNNYFRISSYYWSQSP